MNTEDRFASKVDKRSGGECWPWKGTRLRGYGVFWDGSRQVPAHRYAWQSFFGDIPDGMMILHRCNNPICVNPYHLYPGDHSDNARDLIESGYTPPRSTNNFVAYAIYNRGRV